MDFRPLPQTSSDLVTSKRFAAWLRMLAGRRPVVARSKRTREPKLRSRRRAVPLLPSVGYSL